MLNGKSIQKKGSSHVTPKPATGMFQSRPFAEPNQLETLTPEIQTKAELGNIRTHNLANIQLSASPRRQMKVTIGPPRDKYEQEADTIAQKVMTMPAELNSAAGESSTTPRSLAQTKPLTAAITPLQSMDQMQAQLSELDTKELEKPDEEKIGQIQRRVRIQATTDDNLTAPASLENQINQSKNSGSPLTPQIRTYMEPRFGADFSQVRVHTDSQAVQMNRELGAQAFTHGNDIYYGSGKSPGNDHLTAHELTHTIQQMGANSLQTQSTLSTPSAQISRMGDPLIQGKYLEDPKLFYDHTYIGFFTSRGLHGEIDKKLKEYNQLQRNDIYDVDLNYIDQKLRMLLSLGDVIETWVNEYFQNQDGQQKRLDPTLQLQEEIENEIKALLIGRSDFQEDSREQVEDQLRGQEMDACLKSKVAPLINAAVPNKGGKAELEVKLAIDVCPPGYLGFDLNLELERSDKDSVKVRAELAATGGVRVPAIFDVKGKIGGYLEAEAQDSRKAMNLVSYGLYRRFLESKLIPERLVTTIWGGSWNKSVGKYKAQKFAQSAEQQIFGTEGGEEAYVDLGFLAGISAEIGDEEAMGGSIGYKYTTGKKYTKGTLEGEDTSAHEFTAKLSAGVVGIEGEVKFRYIPAESKKEVEASVKYSKLGETSKVIAKIAEGIRTIFDTMNQSSKKNTTRDVVNTVEGDYKLWTGLHELGSQSKIELIEPKADDEEEKVGVESNRSVRVVVGFEKEETNPWEGSVSVESLQGLELKGMDKVLKVSAERAKRIIAFDYQNGSWSAK